MFCHDPSTDSKFVPGIFPDTESPVPKIPGQLRSPKQDFHEQDLFIRGKITFFKIIIIIELFNIPP